ncbi:MAG: alkaline phosphatase family protein [Capsulimonadales bacterium]|nr:alkaline phosphatase family protein [Capsulimonadales bacterium]
MRRSLFLSLFLGLTGVGSLCALAALPAVRSAFVRHPVSGERILVPGQIGEDLMLHNGWRVRPVGRSLSLGDFPLANAFSPDGKQLAFVNSGFNSYALHLIDPVTEKEVASFPVRRAWNGIAWSPEGDRLFLSGGSSNPDGDILIFTRKADGGWAEDKPFQLTGNRRERTCIGGITLSADGKTLFAANNSDDHLYALDAATGRTLARMPVGDHPGVCRLGRDGGTLYVACWGGKEIAVVDVRDREKPTVSGKIPVGLHPNDLTISADNRLFVCNAGDDSVTVHDLKTGKRMETVRTTLSPKAPYGSTPNALALSPDGKTLYAANADNNSVCVIDTAKRGQSRVRGFLPTGWYPTAVCVTPDGGKLVIGTGKGTGTGPNGPANRGPIPDGSYTYHGALLRGLLSFVDVPDEARLADYTKIVRDNVPYRDSQLTRAESDRKTAIPRKVGDASPIKHVLYIIKENRTYDQVFGDLPQGNGDKTLCYFPREITPNHHALAEQFVLLDNLYCNGEVSQDGHPWSTQGISTSFNQRAWVVGYSGHGELNENEKVNESKGGYIWEACKRKGLTVRSYGEYDQHPSFGKDISEEYIGKVKPGQNPPGRDFEKADVFVREFQEMVRENRVPNFMIMSLGEDHTDFSAPGKFTPQACVGSNDVGLGKIVEAISKSPLWNRFAIFVIEDDAQNAPDHVDSHRTVGLVISPYTRRKTVDSTMYGTASMLRSIELIFGLTPMTQYTAAATPMFNAFTDKADLTPYTALPARIDLMAKNPGSAVGAAESSKIDLSGYDRLTVADEDRMNRVLWHHFKGKDTPYPGVVRSAITIGQDR